MQSVPLWCDYLNFVQERDQLVSQCAPAGVLKMRNLFERALTAAGLHIAEGSKIWEAYREYEQAILLTIGGDNNEEKSKQVHRIHALFHRQLSVPLVDLKSTLENYKVWEVEKGDTSDANLEVDGIPSNIVSAYKKALEMYNARRMYEDHLSKSDASDADRLQSFMVEGHPTEMTEVVLQSIDSDVKLVGKDTFAAPRAVRPLGWTNIDAKPADSVEKPKSNDEFRSMLLKK